MLLLQLEKEFDQLAEGVRQKRYPQALQRALTLAEKIPGNIAIGLARAECLLADGNSDAAALACGQVMDRLKEMAAAAGDCGDLLDPRQAAMLAENIAAYTRQAQALTGDTNARAEESRGQKELKDTIAQLELQMTDMKAQADRSASELSRELDEMRNREQAGTQALEGARSQLEELRRTVQTQEAALKTAAREREERESVVELLEQELVNLNKKAADTAAMEGSLSTELKKLQGQETETVEALTRARGDLSQLQQRLENREQELQQAAALNAQRESQLSALEHELADVRAQMETASRHEESLAAEVQAMRHSEQEKIEELNTARAALDQSQSMLAAREEALAKAVANQGEHDAAMERLRREFAQVQQQTKSAATSEVQLAEEVSKLRSSETKTSAALEQTRLEMDRLQKTLAGHEQRLLFAKAQEEPGSEITAELKAEVDALQQKAEQFKDSETKLSQQLAKLQREYVARSEDLKHSRTEMDELRSRLATREEALKQATSSNATREQDVERLRHELEEVKHLTAQASNSEAGVAAELAHLRQSEAAKHRALEETRRELENLKAAHERHASSMQANSQDDEAYQKKIVAMQEEIVGLHAKTKEVSSAESGLARQLDTLRDSERRKTESLERAREELRAIRDFVRTCESDTAKATTERDANYKIIQDLQSELDNLKKRAPAESPQTKPVRPEPAGQPLELDRSPAPAKRERKVVHVGRSLGSRVLPVLLALFILAIAGFGISRLYNNRNELIVPQDKGIIFDFPDDRVIGTLYSQDKVSVEDDDWQVVAEAQGKIQGKPGLVYQLKLNDPESRNLAALDALAPNSLYSLGLTHLYATPANIGHLVHLGLLQELYVDDAISAKEKDALETALHNTYIRVKPPVAVLEAEAVAPPAVRTLNFGTADLGRLLIRPWKTEGQGTWQENGRAHGAVTIPAGKEVKLEVDSDAGARLGLLEKFAPEALDAIGLVGKNVTDASLASIAGLTGLSELKLLNTAAGDAGFARLDKLIRLHRIELFNVPLSDTGFAVFAHYDHLSYLWIQQANITNGVLGELRAMSSLRRLHITGTKISDEGLVQLKYQMPWCEISPLPQGLGATASAPTGSMPR